MAPRIQIAKLKIHQLNAHQSFPLNGTQTVTEAYSTSINILQHASTKSILYKVTKVHICIEEQS